MIDTSEQFWGGMYLFQPSKYVTHSAGWSSSNAVYHIQEMHGSNLNQISAVLNEVFVCFLSPSQQILE
jgi:hypothetical protein